MLSALAWLWRRVDKLAKKAIRGNSVCSTYFRFRVGAQLGKVDVSKDIMMNRMPSLLGLVLMLSTFGRLHRSFSGFMGSRKFC